MGKIEEASFLNCSVATEVAMLVFKILNKVNEIPTSKPFQKTVGRMM